MIKIAKEYTNFHDLILDLEGFNINDQAIEGFIEEAANNSEYGYEEAVNYFLSYISSNPPGYFNSQFPSCPTLSVTNNYVTYMHNGIGVGINTSFRQSGIHFILSFVFTVAKAVAVHNPIYVEGIQRGFKEEMGKPYSTKNKTEE